MRETGLSATFLRPTSFMENYLAGLRGLRDGALVTPLGPDLPESLIAVADIAVFAALAFADPDAFRGQVSLNRTPDPAYFERESYVRMLQSWSR